ncbi:MAG: hypothetical protein QME07_07665 [bacterium]|nr:hypothetical protein [bacterium]
MRDFLKTAGVRLILPLIIGASILLFFGKINWAISFLAGAILAGANIFITSLGSLKKKVIFLLLGKYTILSIFIFLLLLAGLSAPLIAVGFTLPLIALAWQGIKEASNRSSYTLGVSGDKSFQI